jgi:DtxR family Mn-dependent transcriptional regulator
MQPDEPPDNAMSAAREDFVKKVYALTVAGQIVTNRLLAQELGISAPSVSVMLNRLSADGLVTRSLGRRIQLTDRGERAALNVIRRHRLVERLLVDLLGMSPDEVHPEAERLEHAVSARLTHAIDVALGHPTEDPHGKPIPS